MKKIRDDQAGFTLLELLFVCVLLLLFSSIIALGATMAADSYSDTMAYAEAQTLNGTLTMAISDKLWDSDSSGSSLDVNDDGYVTYGTGLLLPEKTYARGLKVEDLSCSNSGNIYTVKYKICGRDESVYAEGNFQVKSYAG